MLEWELRRSQRIVRRGRMNSVSGIGAVPGLRMSPEGWRDSILVMLTGDAMGPDDGASHGVRIRGVGPGPASRRTVFMAARIPARVQSVSVPGTEAKGSRDKDGLQDVAGERRRRSGSPTHRGQWTKFQGARDTVQTEA